jgi:signal transduction histidine kinase
MYPNDLEHLLNLSRRMVETRALQPLLDYAMSEAIQFVGAERGHIVLLNDDGSLDFRVTQSLEPVEEDENAQDQVSMSILQEVVQTTEPLVIRNAMLDPKWRESKSVFSLKLRSVMCVPFISNGVVICAIYFENRSIDNRFAEEDLNPLILFANQASASIENARLYTYLEQEVQKRTEELFQEVQERRRVEETLRDFNDELKARNEELDAFVHTVAHDLQNPVSLLIGYTEMLLDDELVFSATERRDYLSTIKRTSHKVNNIIEELLLLAGVRKMQVRPLPLDMAAVVNETLLRLSDVLDEANVELSIPSEWPSSIGYGPWVEEVWANYISNACKYGGHPPCIELGAALQSDGMVRFWVKDNGAGLTEDERARLFVPFSRLNQVRARGTGLGLSIVRRIVERLEGEAGVESQAIDGQGSIFYFTLPAISPG